MWQGHKETISSLQKPLYIQRLAHQGTESSQCWKDLSDGPACIRLGGNGSQLDFRVLPQKCHEFKPSVSRPANDRNAYLHFTPQSHESIDSIHSPFTI
jgi:hypothetical protein